MRDIVFKNITSIDHHRRDIFLSEAYTKNGVTTRTQKHFIYSIRDHTVLKSTQELEAWLKEHSNASPHLKDLSALRSHDSKSGEEKFEVKITGNLYILHEQDIFNIDFTQVFSIDRKSKPFT